MSGTEMKWRIGKVTVTKIVELEVTGGSRFILPQATYEEILPIGWLQPHFADERGRLKMSIHALVVETPERRIIVDTCLGNDKQNRRIPTWNNLQGPFLADLAAAGYLREVVETDHRICDEITLVPTTGHTPGHVSVHIRSQGETALITGDFMHHPCQIARPDWSSTADSDPDEARATRERMLAELAGRPVLVIGTHFAGATAGHIVRDGDAYRLAMK